MNGRIYDPKLGRFLQADPNVDGVTDTQGYNRYTYVGNNPLTYTDPSGYFKLREIVGAVVGVVLAIYCAPCTASWYGAMGAGAVAGAAGAAANGGNILQGALYGGISAAAFYGVASGFEGSNLAGTPAAEGAIRAGKDLYLTGTNFAKLVAAQASVGGVMSVLQGGKFGHGFVSAGLTKAATPTILSFDNVAAESIASGVVGGTASELTGGKFANGASTGAFLYAFNALASGAQKREPLLLDEDQSTNVFKIHRYDTDGVVMDEHAQSLATDMYFKALKADEGMIWVERVFKAFAGGLKPKPGGILSMGTSTMTSEAKEYFKVGEYKSIEARLSATGAGIIHTNAANVDNRIRYSELNRE